MVHKRKIDTGPKGERSLKKLGMRTAFYCQRGQAPTYVQFYILDNEIVKPLT